MADKKFPFTKEQFVRNGKLQVNLLRPALEQYIRRWGYYDKETTCKVFEFVVELLQEDMNGGKKKTTGRRSQSVSLPSEPKVEPAKSAEEVVDGKDDLELL